MIYGASGLLGHLAAWACLKVNEPLSSWWELVTKKKRWGIVG